MANSTYLELTNELLRRLVEGQVTETDFPSVRSVQATAKDCIRASVSEINAKEKEWPFQYGTETQVLVPGTMEYNLPTDCKTPDWESFYVQKDETLGNPTKSLIQISRDEWMKIYRPLDLDQGLLGRDLPEFVFNSSYGGVRSFGVTPSPNQAYIVKYEYYKKDSELVLYSDQVTIPQEWDYVIINGALKHYYMSRDNTQQAAAWSQEFDKTLNQMRHTLIPKKDNVFTNVVNFGGQRWRSQIGGM